MLKTRKRWISLLVTLAMLVAFVVPFAGPASAAGISVNVSKVPSVNKDATGTITLGTVQISEDADFPNDLAEGDTFVATLPDGVNWDTNLTVAKITYGNTTTNLTVVASGDHTLNITIPSGAVSPTQKDFITIIPVVTFDGYDGGDIKLNINGLDTAIPSGDFVIGRGESTGSEAVALEVKTIGEGSAKECGRIRITEKTVGSFTTANGQINLTLPNNFSWNSAMDDKSGNAYVYVKALAGFTDSMITKVEINPSNDKKLTITYNIPSGLTSRGIIEIRPIIDVDSDADYGNVDVDIDGDDVDDATVTIADYEDFGATLTVADSTPAQVVAGQADQEFSKLILEEKTAGSLISGRNIEIDLPSGVLAADNASPVEVSLKSGSTILGTPSVNDDRDTIKIPVNGTSTSKVKAEIKFKHFNVSPAKTGDISVKVKGSAGVEGEYVIAKALAPLTATVTPVDVKIGVKEQSVNDILLTEAMDGAVIDDPDNGNAEIRLDAPDGVTFASVPTVTVTQGNLDLGDPELDNDDNVLVIPVNSSSTKVSTIKISGLKLNVDRTVPEGALNLTLKGAAVASTYEDYIDNGATYGFNTEEAGKFTVANCITPAPGEQKGTAVFKIGEAKYTVNGQEYTMDVAPVAEAGRTYLPARFVANAMGVPDSNIIWDQANQTVTVIRNDRIVQMKVGSNQILVNGIALTMDVAPKVVPGRVLIPFRFLAQALGAEVVWDAADPNTITLNF